MAIITGVIGSANRDPFVPPLPPQRISGGYNHSLFTNESKVAYGWGNNGNGQVGNNSTNTQSLRTAVCCGLAFCEVSSGLRHSLGITTTGTVYAWGRNNSGQLGDNTGTNKSTPVAVCNAAGLITFKQISAGYSHCLGITTTGVAYAWGNNSWGQLGINSYFDKSTPVAVCGGLIFKQISANGEFSLGITEDGIAYAWGNNDLGQLGNNTLAVEKLTPSAVCGGLTFREISAGDYHSLGLTTTGILYAWGYNFYGQLGDNSTIERCTPVAVCGGLIFSRIAAGADSNFFGIGFSLGITTSGVAYAWGGNSEGQLGDNTKTNKSTPVAVCGGLTFSQIDAGASFSLGIATDGKVYGWGYNDTYQLGMLNRIITPVSPLALASYSFTQISVGYASTCALTDTGIPYCWGFAVAIGDNSFSDKSSPVPVCGGLTLCKISVGLYHSVGIATDGSTWSWGENSTGTLGNNTTTESRTPVRVCLPPLTFTQISGGRNHSLGLTTGGIVYAWGSNSSGELGDNTTTNKSTPVAVCGGLTFSQISGGFDHSLGITTTGIAYAWGGNSFGQLGNNTTTSTSTPVAVCGGLTFSQVSVGDKLSLGITTTGVVYAWGSNSSGQLGDNTTTNRSTPVAVCGGLTFSQVSAGGHSLGITTTGVAYAWGPNNLFGIFLYGQLGDNTTTNRSTPVAVCGGLTFSQVSAGSYYSLGITTTGVAYGWGQNGQFQLGDGSSSDKSTPVAVCGGLTFSQISAGERHSLGITTTGIAYSWGQSNVGQLGNNTTEFRSTPVAVCGGLTFSQISAGGFGGYGSVGITTTGIAYSWGNNNNGLLGDNTTTNRSTPVAVCNNNLKQFKDVSAGFLFSVGVTHDGVGYAWGYNDRGQLGDNTITDKSTPVAICGGLVFSKIVANTGQPVTLGLTTGGIAYAWGSNNYRQLGDNSASTASKSTPVAVCGGHTFCDINFGNYHAMAIRTSDRQGFTWGLNNHGELGDNTTSQRCTPVTVVDNPITFSQISGGFRFSIGISTTGVAYGWGTGTSGQLGDNTTTNKSTPVAVCGGLTFKQISAGYYHSLGLTTTGILYAWGNNSNGQLGDNTTTNRSTPVAVCGGLTFSQVSAGYFYSLGITTTGVVYAWGSNNGQLGDNTTTNRSTPVAVCGGLTFSQVSAGVLFSLGITTAGIAYGWGNNNYGQLGDNTATTRLVPTAVCGGLTFAQISVGNSASFVGDNYGLGVTTTGIAYAWGNNSNGQLGDNTVVSKRTPVAVCGGLTFKQISGGINNLSLAITTTGIAYVWGNNNAGGFGNNATANRSTPVAVCGGLTFSQVSAGENTSYGIITTGIGYAWGRNSSGQLGDNTVVSKLTPVTFCGVKLSFTRLDGGIHKTLGLTAIGEVYSWGLNDYGQLGVGDYISRRYPVSVCNVSFSVLDISSDNYAGFILPDTANGAYVWGFGGNRGQLGDNGEFDYITTPTQIEGI
jgi:alpha-tubulin suppressor-like RCC1 family protein